MAERLSRTERAELNRLYWRAAKMKNQLAKLQAETGIADAEVRDLVIELRIRYRLAEEDPIHLSGLIERVKPLAEEDSVNGEVQAKE